MSGSGATPSSSSTAPAPAAQGFARVMQLDAGLSLGFEALQDAYLEETKLHAQKAADHAIKRAARAMDRLRFQNTGLKTQLEQNRVASQSMQNQFTQQLSIAKKRIAELEGTDPDDLNLTMTMSKGNERTVRRASKPTGRCGGP